RHCEEGSGAGEGVPRERPARRLSRRTGAGDSATAFEWPVDPRLSAHARAPRPDRAAGLSRVDAGGVRADGSLSTAREAAPVGPVRPASLPGAAADATRTAREQERLAVPKEEGLAARRREDSDRLMVVLD